VLGKSLEEIGEKDLQLLIDNRISERKNFEYKSQLPGGSDADKKEFLADISSFANASGGTMIYGIKEDENHAPKELAGLQIVDVDETEARLDSMIRTGISPRLPRFAIKEIALSNSNYAIVIEIQKSWISPHRVILLGHDKFYSRSSNGKYPMDVGELKLAFTASETVSQKIKSFVLDRVSNIYASQAQIPLVKGLVIVIHLVPVVSFDSELRTTLDNQDYLIRNLRPIKTSSWDYFYNIDGFLTHNIRDEGQSSSYIQLARNGVIEAVFVDERSFKDKKLHPEWLEEIVLLFVQHSVQVIKELGLEPPISVFTTLAGTRGYSRLPQKGKFKEDTAPEITKDLIFLPSVLVDDFNYEAQVILRPSFDALANAFGLPRSRSYDKEGKWIRKLES
jgi:hypothetical protein